MTDRDTILVVAAHPDDEVLGCGATLARHAAAGDRVEVFIAATGAASRGDGDAAIKALQDAARAAASTLGVDGVRFGGLPDNALDKLPLLDVVQTIEAVVAGVRPTVVYTHHGGDLNVDHQIVHQAVRTACRPLPGTAVRQVRCFETPSSTEWGGASGGGDFRPTIFIDVAGFMAAKRRALECYAMEMRLFPHARSMDAVDALAVVRGAQSGLAAAEAFSLIWAREP